MRIIPPTFCCVAGLSGIKPRKHLPQCQVHIRHWLNGGNYFTLCWIMKPWWVASFLRGAVFLPCDSPPGHCPQTRLSRAPGQVGTTQLPGERPSFKGNHPKLPLPTSMLQFLPCQNWVSSPDSHYLLRGWTVPESATSSRIERLPNKKRQKTRV